MKTDRELLELAAKAAAVQLRFLSGVTPFSDGPDRVGEWNPLKDDGDALRLANKLLIEIRHVNGKVHAGYVNKFWRTENWFPDGDINQATRLAIVRAAAAIGEAMP